MIKEKLSERRQWLSRMMAVLFPVLIIIIIGSKIPKICTVWELGDEAGYLFNTAYFLGYDWSSFASVSAYYGFGYSIFLIPVWIVTQSGVALIRGAIVVNLLCVLGIYVVIRRLMIELTGQENDIIASVISFVVCLCPYLVCNSLKVFCETELTLLFCLSIWNGYKALQTNNTRYYLFLIFSLTYMRAIHTRAVVLVGAIIVCLLYTVIIFHKIKLLYKRFLLLLFGVGIGLFLCDCVQNNIVQYMSSIRDTGDVGNVIDSNMVANLWMNFLNNFKEFVLAFLCRLFYLSIMTVGTCFSGAIGIYQDLKFHKQKNEMADYGIKLCIVLSMLLVILVHSLNISESYPYIFYGRYYAYVVIPFMALSIYYAISRKFKRITWVYIVCTLTFLSKAALHLVKVTGSSTITVDTNRIPDFTLMIDIANNNYVRAILFGAISVFVILFVGNRISMKYQWVLLLPIAAFVFRNSALGANIIVQVNEGAKNDAYLAEYILNNQADRNVYMIEDQSFKYVNYWSRMQVLLKDIPLSVIETENSDDYFDYMGQIEDGSYVLVYNDSQINSNSDCELIKEYEGTIFALYEKQSNQN